MILYCGLILIIFINNGYMLRCKLLAKFHRMTDTVSIMKKSVLILPRVDNFCIEELFIAPSQIQVKIVT